MSRLSRKQTPFDTDNVILERARQATLTPTWPDLTPKRVNLRRQIASRLYGKGAARRSHQAYLVIGPPAAGKSTVSDALATTAGALVLDSDLAKEWLPEFDSGRGAARVHDESDIIVNTLVLAKALDAGDNIVWPLVGRDVAKIRELRDVLITEGYDVHLVLVDLPPEKAAQRAVERFEKTGRFVDPLYVLIGVGTRPQETYAILRREGGFASYVHVSTDVPQGYPPKVIEGHLP